MVRNKSMLRYVCISIVLTSDSSAGGVVLGDKSSIAKVDKHTFNWEL